MLANVPRPGRDFGGATRYLMHGAAGAEPDPNRVLWTATRNLTTDDPQCAAKIMTATAALSARVERPVYHLIVSWAAAEQPTRDAMDQVIGTTLADIGLDGHQAVVFAHGDTANPHVHMLINRVHPDTGTAWSTKHDYRRIERSIFKQAGAMGFIAVPGRHSRPDQKRELTRMRSKGAMLKARKQRDALKPWSRQHTQRVAPQLNALLAGSKSWGEAQRRIREFGGELERKGQGLIIRDRRRTGYVKLSSLDAKQRVATLERQFGASLDSFEAGGGFLPEPTQRPSEWVSEMDIALALYSLGLVNRDAITSAAANREAKLAEAPLHTREMRALKRTLRDLMDPEPEPATEKPSRNDPEPQR